MREITARIKATQAIRKIISNHQSTLIPIVSIELFIIENYGLGSVFVRRYLNQLEISGDIKIEDDTIKKVE